MVAQAVRRWGETTGIDTDEITVVAAEYLA